MRECVNQKSIGQKSTLRVETATRVHDRGQEDAGDQEDRGDDDEDVKALRAVDEEPVRTIGVDGEKCQSV